ncbi:MAG: hypothetical protein WC705_00305 [Candidatus Paceibacterota bacterium]|jgi:hypothetical protein
MIEITTYNLFLFIALLLGSFLFFFYKNKDIKKSVKYLKIFCWIVIIFYVAYPLVTSFLQYRLWSSNDFAKNFLENSASLGNIDEINQSPVLEKIFGGEMGYFLFYAFNRFWINSLLVLALSLVWLFILKYLVKYQERFFYEGETNLGFLACLCCGWPAFVVFFVFLFIMIILVSLVKKIIFKEEYTTLGIPFVLAGLIGVVFGNIIVNYLGLSVLFI